MNKSMRPCKPANRAALGIVLLVAAGSVLGQSAGGPAASSMSSDPNPYYVGVSQALTHDSNVFRIPFGPSDNYSSTSLFGGFDQPISRQRVFGRGSIGVNRYQDQSQLNNASYDVAVGADWATIENLSGNVNLGLNRSLAPPTGNAGTPTAVRNLATGENADARIRWGGPAILTLEGTVGYSRLDYSAPEYVSSEARGQSESLGIYYRPGSLLRLGLAGRVNRSESPKAFFDPVSGAYQGNTTKGKNLDLTADYELSGQLSANGRLSYTKQKNSSDGSTGFSGLTGSLGVNWRATGKTSVSLNASRDAGFDAALFNTVIVTTNNGFPTFTPVAGRYENNRTTDAVQLGVSYAATAKISANARVYYTNAKLSTTNIVAGVPQAGPENTDESSGISVGANYAITRAWGLGCNAAHSKRSVSGATPFSYTDTTFGCSTQFVWR